MNKVRIRLPKIVAATIVSTALLVLPQRLAAESLTPEDFFVIEEQEFVPRSLQLNAAVVRAIGAAETELRNRGLYSEDWDSILYQRYSTHISVEFGKYDPTMVGGDGFEVRLSPIDFTVLEINRPL